MITFTFSNETFTLNPFTNAAGKERFKLKDSNNEVLFSFSKDELSDTEDFLDTVVSEICDRSNRNSIFNTKVSCEEFGKLIIKTLN